LYVKNYISLHGTICNVSIQSTLNFLQFSPNQIKYPDNHCFMCPVEHVELSVVVLLLYSCFQLCEKSRMSPHSTSRQIQLDLHRTLTTNQHFSSPSSPILQKLQRILLAFSWQNPTIGYCQGLNR